jgi:hypothetical protein
MIHPHHFRGWLSSAVSPDIIALNVRSLSGDEAIERLTENAIERIGEGQRVPHSHQYATGPVKKILDRYRGMSDDGWWCAGIDVLTGEPSPWGCFKPDRPRRSADGKPIKYEHPAGTPTGIFALRIPYSVGLKIADRHGLADDYLSRFAGENPLVAATAKNLRVEDRGFWQWAIDNNLPIAITEGSKKAGALLTEGYAAIALPGIFNGYRQERDESGKAIGLPTLIPQLLPFASERREITFVFDNDPKPKTRKSVRVAIEKTGRLFKYRGCDVSIVRWDSPHKGIDDLIAALGTETLDRVYGDRISLEEFKLGEFTAIDPDLTINERYIPTTLAIPEKATIIALKSPKGTGKTEFLAARIAPPLARGKRVLVIVHREQLAIALSARFGIDYRTEIFTSDTGGELGYCLCIDSAHEKAHPPLKPGDWEGATVIIDEVEQVLWHVLEGDTCRQKRVNILKAFRELLRKVAATGGKIYLADADLTSVSIAWVRSLIGFPVASYIVENVYRSPVNRFLTWFEGEDPAELVTALKSAIKRGEKPFVLTDGRKQKSTWGTRNLEHHTKKEFPRLKILRLDQESVADPKHPAFGCMTRLDEVLSDYDMVIASPTIETGVSIDLRGHFTSVWAISHGVQTLNSVCQGLARVREDIPRYLWAREYSPTRIGNGAIELKTFLSSTHKLTAANIALLQKAGIHEAADLDFVESDLSFSPSLTAWAKRACIVNHQNRNFRSNLLAKLGDEYTLEKAKSGGDPSPAREAIKESRDELYREHCQAVIEADDLSDREYEALSEKRARTEDELNRLKKAKIARRYITDNPTAALVAKDDDDWYPKLRLQYFLTIGNRFLHERDRRSLAEMRENGDGAVFKPDINRSQLSAKIETLKLIGIEMFFDPRREFTGDRLRDWFDRLNNPIAASHIRTILGVSITPKDSPIAFVQRLLKQLFGQKLPFDRQEMIDGVRRRYYRGCDPDPDGRGEIFARWFERDERGISPPLENVSRGYKICTPRL